VLGYATDGQWIAEQIRLDPKGAQSVIPPEPVERKPQAEAEPWA
jgi:hypothetical protein